MALTKDVQIELLKNLVEQVEQDIFRQELERDAQKAELDIASEAHKPAVQANLDNTEMNLTRLNARLQAWQTHLDKLNK